MTSQTIAYYCLIAGASMLVGWWTAFRNRPYLAYLGGFFISLAGVIAIGNRLGEGEKTAQLKWEWWCAVAVAGALFLAAFVTAVQESFRRVKEMREHYRAAAEAMLEMTRMKEELARRQKNKPEDGAQEKREG